MSGSYKPPGRLNADLIQVLVLMLQAAVRGPSKGECVEQIQHLSTSIQLWIMHIIKKAENNPEGGPQSDIELLVEVRFGQIMAETESLGVENESLRSEISRLRDQLKENSEYCELFNEAERALGEARAEKESFKKFNAERDEVIAGLEVRLNNVLGEKESLEGENRSLQKKIEQLAAGAQSLLKEYDEAMEDESTKIKDGDIALGNLKQELADLRSEHEQKILEAVEEARDNLINQHTLEMPKSNDKKDRLLCLMTNLCLEYRALRCRLQKVTSSEVAALLSTREPIKGADEAEIHDAIEHYLEREADCSSPVGTMLDSLPIAGHGSTESTPASPTVPSDSPSTSGVIEARSPEGDGASLSGHVGNSLDSEMLDWSPQNTNSELDPTQSPVMQECEASESTPVLDVTNGVPMEECARSPSLAGDVLFTGHAQKSIPRGLASAPAGSEDTSQPPTPHRYTPPTRTLLPSEADKKFGKHQGPSTDTTADNSGPISPLTTHGNDGSKLPINSIESTLASTASPINTVRPRVEDTVANGHDASSTSIIPGPEVDNTVSSAGPHMDSMDVTEKEDPLPKSVGGFGGVEVLVASPGPRVSSPGKWVEPATLGLSTESLPLAPTDSHDVSPIPPTPNGRNSKNGSDNTSMTPPSNCHAVSGEDNEAAPGSEELTHDFSQPLPSAHTTQKGLPHDTSTGGSSNADRPRASEQTADRQLRWDSQQAVIPPKAKKVTRHANLIAQQNLPGSDDSCDDCSSHHSSADARTPHASELVSDRVTAVNNPHAFESKYGLTVHQVQFVIDCADNRELFRRDLSTFLRDNYPLWRRSGIWCREQYHIPTSKRERHQNPTSQSDRARRIRALLGVEKKCDDDTVLRKLFAAHLALVEYESLLESFQHSIPRVSMPDSAAIDMIVEGQMVRRESVKRQLKVSRYLKRITDELGLGILLTGGSYLWTLIQGKNMTHGMWDCLAFHVTEEFPHFKAIAGLLEGIAKIFANEALDRLPTPEDFEVILKKVQDLEVTNDSRPSDDDSFEMQSSTNDFVDDDPRKTFKCSNRAGGDLLNDSSSSPLEKDVTTPIIIPVCHKSASPFAASAAADQLMSMAETDSSPPTKPYLTPRRTPKSARLTGRLASPDSLTATASKQFRSTPGTVNEDSTMTPSLPTPCPVSKRRYNGSETGPKKRRRVQSPPPNRSLNPHRSDSD
ncbi:hypothetical protein DL95DRAFT_136756 [Leptodontidium sp. 2 PMI_412]|nr:hypothetical protein DL95DRAFT_136756 [Leptodontidium sp. 2 PMI_412]